MGVVGTSAVARGCVSQTMSAPSTAIVKAMTNVQRDCVARIMCDLTFESALIPAMLADSDVASDDACVLPAVAP